MRYTNALTLMAALGSLLKVKDEACFDVDCGHEYVNAAVVYAGNTPPIFQLCAHVVDHVTLFIKTPVVRLALISGSSLTGYKQFSAALGESD